MYLKVTKETQKSVFENYIRQIEEEFNVKLTEDQKKKFLRYLECFSTIN
jgi:hypothetical protein